MKIPKTAGPSPVSTNLKSNPHLSQLSRKLSGLSGPENNCPLPQRGQTHFNPATNGDGDLLELGTKTSMFIRRRATARQ
jgi:hypothetical protein